MINSIIESIGVSLNAEFGDFLKTDISGKINSAYNTFRMTKTERKKSVMRLLKGFFCALNILLLPGIWCVAQK